jgi:cell division septation protein DedD
MARSSSGKSVARAAATGGGATYRGQMPVNWYAALVVIVLVGLGSVAFAKYHYNQSAAAVDPAIGTTWHSAISFDVCGTVQPALAASPTSATTGLTTTGSGVLLIAPKTSGQAGANATVGKFASGYTGLTLTNTSLKLPAAKATEYQNGEKCPAGTPDAGKVGEMLARSWVITTQTKHNQLVQTGGATTTKPADLKFLNRQLITVGFVPEGTKLPKPPGTTISALLQVLSGSQPVATTTTTAPGATTTSTPTTTSSTAATTTSTTAAPTTTTKPTTTTTTASSTTTTK